MNWDLNWETLLDQELWIDVAVILAVTFVCYWVLRTLLSLIARRLDKVAAKAEGSHAMALERASGVLTSFGAVIPVGELSKCGLRTPTPVPEPSPASDGSSRADSPPTRLPAVVSESRIALISRPIRSLFSTISLPIRSRACSSVAASCAASEPARPATISPAAHLLMFMDHLRVGGTLG